MISDGWDECPVLAAREATQAFALVNRVLDEVDENVVQS